MIKMLIYIYIFFKITTVFFKKKMFYTLNILNDIILIMMINIE